MARQAILSNEERYGVSNYIRDAVSERLPEGMALYMEELNKFFTEMGAFAHVVRRGGSAGSLLSVLTQICTASLKWHKPFERLSRFEMSKPRDAAGHEIPEMSVATVSRKLGELERDGIIVRFQIGSGTAPFYAIRVKKVFERISKRFNELGDHGSYSRHLKETWKRLSESPLLDVLDGIISAFVGHVIQCKNDVINTLKDGFEMLKQKMQNIMGKATNAPSARMSAKADQPFFTADKKDPDNYEAAKPNPSAAMAFWDKAVKDTELFPNYRGMHRKEDFAKMKNWLIECRKNGLSEEDIKKDIRQYVEKWYYVKSTDRTLFVPTLKGRLRECRMEPYPEFDFFYATRKVLIGVLAMASLPGKTPDGEDRLNLSDVIF